MRDLQARMKAHNDEMDRIMAEKQRNGGAKPVEPKKTRESSIGIRMAAE